MSEEQLPPSNAKEGQLGDPPKRKRTPSQYASQINDFKNVPSLSPRTTLTSIKETKARGT
jgi:hypothetical protein